jgi:hypothetical protein
VTIGAGPARAGSALFATLSDGGASPLFSRKGCRMMASRLCGDWGPVRIVVFSATAICLALVACAHASPPPMVWLRTDGQRMADNPALAQQGDIDKTICAGDAQKANLTSLTPVEVNRYSLGLNNNVEAQRSQATADAMKGCMAQKGYLLVPADQAEAMSEQFAAATAAQRQAAATVPAQPPTPPRRTVPKPTAPPPQ